MAEDSYGDGQIDMAEVMAQQAMYGNQEAHATALRSAYGNQPMFAMQGAMNVGTGAYQGMGNMITDLGSRIAPLAYSPPARVNTGYYGQSTQKTGFFSGMAAVAGLSNVPRGVYAMEYQRRQVSDFTERAVGGMAGAGVMGAGLLASAAMTPAFAAAGSALGGAAFGAGGAAIGGMALGMMGPYMLGAAVADKVVDQVQNRRELDNYLESSSFRYVGSGSSMRDPRRGGGMSHDARNQAVDVLRQADFKDPQMDSADIKTILGESSRLGLMSGVQDIEQFKSKFKDLTDGVKTVTKVFETTIVDGLKIIKDFKNIGVDASKIKEVSAMAQMGGLVTGRTAAETMGLGMQGAEMFRGTGVDMGIGYQSNIMNLSAVRAARDAGAISQQTISQAGGEESLAQTMTVSGLQFAQSQAGRGTLAAYANPGDLQRSLGSGSFMDLARAGISNLDTPEKTMRYRANQAKHVSEVGGQMGGMGLEFAQMDYIMKQAKFQADAIGGGSTVEENARVMMQDMQMSQPQIDTMIAKIRNADSQFTANMAAANQVSANEVYDLSEQNFGFNRFTKKVDDAASMLADAVGRPISRGIGNAVEGMSKMYEQETRGFFQADISKTAYSEMEAVLGADALNERDATDLDLGASFASDSSGEAMADLITSGKMEKLGIKDFTKRGVAGPGEVKLDDRLLGGDIIASRADLKIAAEKASRAARLSPQVAATALKEGKLKGVRGIGGVETTNLTVQELIISGKISDKSNLDQISQAMYGKNSDEIDDKQYQAMVAYGGQFNELKETFVDTHSAGVRAEAINPALTTADWNKATKTIDEIAERLTTQTAYSGKGVPVSRGKLNAEAVNQMALSRAYQSKNQPELAKAAYQKAIKASNDASPGVKIAASAELIQEIMASPEFSTDIDKAQQANLVIASVKKEAGSTRLGGMLSSEMESAKDLTKADRDAIQSAAVILKKGTASDLLALDDEAIKSLQKLPLSGAHVLGQRKSLENLNTIAGSESVTKAVGPEKRAAILAQLPGTDAAQKERIATAMMGPGGVGAAQTVQFQEFASAAAGEQSATAGVSGSVGMDATSPEQILRTQVSINQEILNGFRNVAIVLGK